MGKEEQEAFDRLKDLLCIDNVLAHYDPSLELGIFCDASEVGIGAVLFHPYSDGNERPIANVSKTLTDTHRRYSQIHTEAFAVVFALKKFYQFLYGRHFILVTDHKPMLALFGPSKETPLLTANRLAKWALMLSQYDYSVEFCKTCEHGNADALSRLPVGSDHKFDEEEMGEDVDNVCTVRTISCQIMQDDTKLLVKETSKDPVLTQVMRQCQTNVQTSFRTKRNWMTHYPLNMAAYFMGQGL